MIVKNGFGLPRKPQPSGGTQGLVSDMRLLVQTVEKTHRVEEALSDERIVSYRVATMLMLVLVGLIFATTALPDLMPRLAQLFHT
jgi:hypothetical protein